MAESAYEKARRLANESSLSGIDWDQYHDPKFDTLPENLKPEAFEAEKDVTRVARHRASVAYRESPWGYIQHPDTSQQEEIDQSRKTLANIVLKKPLPEGLQMEHTVDRGRYGGAVHKIVIRDPNSADKSDSEVGVGNIRWDGTNGHVSGFYVDDGYRNAVPHMLEAAHAISGAYGHVGPNHSEDMTSYSHKLAKKYAPSSIPDHALVENVPAYAYDAIRHDPMFQREHQIAGDHLDSLSDELAHAHSLVEFPHPAKDHLYEAQGHLEDARVSHEGLSHEDAWYNLDAMDTAIKHAHDALSEDERYSTTGRHLTNLRKLINNAQLSMPSQR